MRTNLHRVRVYLLILIVHCAVYLVFASRHHISAWAWHLQHGDAINFAGRTFVIPRDWRVTTSSETLLVYQRLGPWGIEKSHVHTTVIVTKNTAAVPEREWRELTAGSFRLAGVHDVVNTTIKLRNGQELSCMSGDVLGALNATQHARLVSLVCQTGTASLYVTADQASMSSVMSLLRQTT